MTVTLDGNAYTHIIDTDFAEVKQVQLPEWINDEIPDIDTNVWNRRPLKITYLMRVTNAEKWTLDQVLTGHQKVYIEDDTYDIKANVWLQRLEAEWEADVNWSKPWRIEIELVTVGMILEEGDYTTYTAKWMVAHDGSESDYNYLVAVDETLGKVFITNQYQSSFTERDLSDGGSAVVTQTLNTAFGPSKTEMKSILGKYFAYVFDDSGTPKMRIYKDGALLQTIDLSASPTSWTQDTAVYSVTVSRNGKYIFVENTTANEYALFEGA